MRSLLLIGALSWLGFAQGEDKIIRFEAAPQQPFLETFWDQVPTTVTIGIENLNFVYLGSNV